LIINGFKYAYPEGRIGERLSYPPGPGMTVVIVLESGGLTSLGPGKYDSLQG